MAWNNWYHITANPYGQWLRGDARGWGERKHRIHVEGDYRNPPTPSNYQRALHEQSKRLMKHPAVEFSPDQRRQVAVLFLESLAIQQIRVLAIGVGAKHLHALIQCPADNPKTIIGKAKNHVWMRMVNGSDRLKLRTDIPPLWAVGLHPEPICDGAHHVDAFWYILDHRDEGAWVWCFQCPRDGSRLCRHVRQESW